MEIEIIGTGARMSLSDWFSAHRGICFALPLTNEALAAAHEAFPDQVPVARIVPPEPQPAPVPLTISWRQGQLYLLSLGLLDDAEALIAAIEDPTERRAAQIEFDAPVYERNSAFLQRMWADLGRTPETLDDAFRTAVTL